MADAKLRLPEELIWALVHDQIVELLSVHNAVTGETLDPTVAVSILATAAVALNRRLGHHDESVVDLVRRLQEAYGAPDETFRMPVLH
jgi:hypothetical protein